MTFQRFRKIKIDAADTLYSKIIRYGKSTCQRCLKTRELQAAHIMGRGHKNTRWMLKPVRNAIALCSNCHSWFDGSKDDTPIFDEASRLVFRSDKNAYKFLVEKCGYSWKELENLYALAHRTDKKLYKFEKDEIKKQLKAYLDNLELYV